MSEIYRVLQSDNTIEMGEGFNKFLNRLEGRTSVGRKYPGRQKALKIASRYMFDRALSEFDTPDLEQTANNFIHAVEPPLSDFEQGLVRLELSDVELLQKSFGPKVASEASA